ncbi:MAG: metal ABC transporter ATP-binding protein [Candidatus Heimdallarchaeota archaeon]|nr:metal ABC transporter ATP-binding protein [Candidatus Heimdallarchaeota archaeon]MCK5048335.1 metal ABC transporter ATP-binding protein [Candidatus Heimdallarchaeota archaeon]
MVSSAYTYDAACKDRKGEKPVICLREIGVAYQSNVALYNLNIDIFKGEFIGICGPNGSGKTTLLKTLLGIIKASTGVINIFGSNITNTDIPKAVKLKMGYVPQQNSVDRNFPALVKDVVLMGRYAQIGVGKPFTSVDHEAVEEALKTIDMLEFKNRPIGHLSGGQQQKVMIARALVSNPEILLLDEPTSALDFKMTRKIMELLSSLNKKFDLTILAIHHNFEVIREFSSRVICLNKRILWDGSPEDENLNEVLNSLFIK